MQMVFSGDVLNEQGTVPDGQAPSSVGLRVSVKGLPPLLPQIVEPSKFAIITGSLSMTSFTHLRFFPYDLYSKHFPSMPPHSFLKTGSQAYPQWLHGIPAMFRTEILTNGFSSQSGTTWAMYSKPPGIAFSLMGSTQKLIMSHIIVVNIIEQKQIADNP